MGRTPGTFTSRGRWDQDSVAVSASPASAERPWNARQQLLGGTDLLAINGFDELYDGPGCGEDSDIQYRMSLLGVSGKSLRNLAIQYHIWHPLTKASESSRLRFAEVQKTRDARCSLGIFPLA